MSAHVESSKRVLIVGAGPTGLTAAAFLARQNIDFDIVESRRGPVNDSRALGIHARTLEFMSMLGLDGEFLELGHKTRFMTFHRNERKLFKLDFNVIAKKTRYPYMLVLPQSQTERILARYLQRERVDILWETELLAFSQSKEGVTAEIRFRDGAVKTRPYAYIIGCDGASSLVRTKLGIPFDGETYPLRFLLSEAKIGNNVIDRDSSHVFMGRETTVAVIPQPDDIYRIVGPDFATLSQNQSGPTEVSFNDFAAFLTRNKLLQHVELNEPSRLVSYRIHKRLAKHYRDGRVFIAGDAAHIHSPAGGQGMNTGLNDVANLTWKMAAVIHGEAPVELLDSYELERRAAALSVITNADAAMMTVVSRKLGARFFFDYLAPIITKVYQPQRLMEALAQISWVCPPLPGLHHDETLAASAGRRMPDLMLSDGSNCNRLLGRRQLIGFVSGSERQVGTLRQDPALAGLSTAALARPFIAPHSNRPFEGVVLCRPDGYIATMVSAGKVADTRHIPTLTQLAR